MEEKKLNGTGPKGSIVDFSNVNIRKFSNQQLKAEPDKIIYQFKKYINPSEKAILSCRRLLSFTSMFFFLFHEHVTFITYRRGKNKIY
ncbi:MAG: hypothetical protein WAM14_05470 [Candidatus Nitrosopolaris sp.]